MTFKVASLWGEIVWLLSVPMEYPEHRGESIPALQWRHNECDGVSKHQPHDCLLSHCIDPVFPEWLIFQKVANNYLNYDGRPCPLIGPDSNLCWKILPVPYYTWESSHHKTDQHGTRSQYIEAEMPSCWLNFCHRLHRKLSIFHFCQFGNFSQHDIVTVLFTFITRHAGNCQNGCFLYSQWRKFR